jgi:tetratricopeptide (TPR) repeat protein
MWRPALAIALIAAAAPAAAVPAAQNADQAKALSDSAVDALKAKDNSKARDLAAQALLLQPSVNNLFIHGTACANLQDWACAIADLEKAKAMAAAGGADAPTLNAIDRSMSTAYLFGGRSQEGLDLAAQLKRRDPSSAANVDEIVAAYFNSQAVEKMKGGDADGAEALLDRAAGLAPSSAAKLYVQAANVLAQKVPADWTAVEAEARKALAIDAEDAHANYVVGIARANAHDKAGAVPYLQKAQANAGADAELKADADAALKKLGVQ